MTISSLDPPRQGVNRSPALVGMRTSSVQDPPWGRIRALSDGLTGTDTVFLTGDMLLSANDLTLIARHQSAVVFRLWVKPAARAGDTLATTIGLLGIDAVDAVVPTDLTAADAEAAGYADLETLSRALAPGATGTLYRIRVRLMSRAPT